MNKPALRLLSHRKFWMVAGGLAVIALLALLLLATFPVSLLREMAERRLSSTLEASVKIGALTREEFFSFTPEIVVRDARIRQPVWAGEGDFVKVSRASAHVPVFSLLTGNFTLHSLHISGLELALVRNKDGKSNWNGRKKKSQDGDNNPLKLNQLIIENSRFSLQDAKRRLALHGQISADSRNGLAVKAVGRFNGSPAQLMAKGATLTGRTAGTAWPFSAQLTSDLLNLDTQGTMAGALNPSDMQMKISARAPSLKQLDYVIEAGLFGTQNINLSGKVRHKGKDWFIDTLNGRIGRSQINAKASVLKRDGRTVIDATVHSAKFDFDDLADDAGLAAARAKEARIGQRVIPDTRIDLSKMGPTDGKIRFVFDHLLVKGGSAFQSLKGDLTLKHKILRLDNAVAKLESGQMMGWLQVDSTKKQPILSTEMRVEGTSLDTLIGQPDMISGPLRGLIRIKGPGTTIREAFTHANGKIAFVASKGSVNRTAAFVLGQDLGGALVQKLRDENAAAPLRCAILSFQVRNGVLRPAPFLIDTAISSGHGSGQIMLNGETVAIQINGAAKEKAALKLVDPIRVQGTLSHPAILIAERGKSKEKSGGIVGAIGRSIGSALGLRDKDKKSPQPVATSVNCSQLGTAALR